MQTETHRSVDGVGGSAGCGVLIVEQHVQMALEDADRGYVLSNGIIRLGGSAAELGADRTMLAEAHLG